MKTYLAPLVLSLMAFSALAQTPYKLPSKEVVAILDAPPTPLVVISPTRDALVLVEYESNPPIALLAEPYLRIGGLRINPGPNARQRTRRSTGLVIHNLKSGAKVRVILPQNATIDTPIWSHDGTKIAFTRDLPDGIELWLADAQSGRAGAVGVIRLNDVLGTPFSWGRDGIHLLVRTTPPGRGKAPETPQVPVGPDIDETAGKTSRPPTYQDLLRTPQDENLFEYYATSQLVLVNAQSGTVKPIGKPGMYTTVDFSPDEKHLLVTRLKRPFSYRVPYFYFSRSIEVWEPNGGLSKTIVNLPVSDEVPTQGVTTGPRQVQWQPLQDATLIWVEALDGGDPLKKVPFRDRVMSTASPFENPASALLKIKHRHRAFEWTGKKNEVLIEEFDRDRRWRTTYFVNLTDPAATQKVLFNLSVQDAYNHPGTPIYQVRSDGQRVMLQDGDWIYLSGVGASEQGDRPFLDKMNLKTLAKERLFHSAENSYEQFLSFAKDSRAIILTRHETKADPPNYFLLDLMSKSRQPLTDFKDPAPQLTRLRKELVKYSRADGVQLTGTLYLPPDYQAGTRLPCLIWAYPLEYSDADTAGQVRGSPNRFTRMEGPSPLFFLTQGYAVLMDATMPVIGDPETMNNTYVQQITEAASAAIAKLDAMGVVDRNRVCIGGHSYGAFMTANLLAHTDLFAAGIARSGAYNRSLTPFGFQTERRSYWEATDLYTRISPFTHANKINEPILLIHGEADDNSGTYPIQSERLFQALRGHGATARLVLLPYEAHGYRGRESVLHVLAEMFEWADKYVKHRTVRTAATSAPQSH